jgi:hypothetical protein
VFGIREERTGFAGFSSTSQQKIDITYAVFWWGNLRERAYSEDLSLDGRIIHIQMDLKYVGWQQGRDLSGLGYGQVADACERGNEHSGSMKCWEFLD